MTTRRSFLSFLGSLPLGANLIAQAMPAIGSQSNLAFSDELDEALEMLAPYSASFRGGLSNHGPMTAEAMVALGHQDEVKSWVASYRKRLELRPPATKPIDPKKWQEALGKKSRVRDWDNLFTKELAESSWQEVIALWVPRLAPGIAAAALHGVIRVGHAVCALTARKNKLRLDELARSLGYWASEYLSLPGKPSESGGLSPSAALKKVEMMPVEKRGRGGLISKELKELLGFEPFANVAGLVDTKLGSPTFMADLVATFAGVYINTNDKSFEFLHAITGSAAVVELLPHVKKSEQGLVMVHIWQATAAIFARFGQVGLVAEIKNPSGKVDGKKLAKLAVAGGSDHTIKLVAACHREFLRNPDPRLMLAARKRVF